MHFDKHKITQDNIIRSDKRQTQVEEMEIEFSSVAVNCVSSRDEISEVTWNSLFFPTVKTHPFQRLLGPISLIERIGMDVLKVHEVTRSTWNLRENPRSPFVVLQFAAAGTDRPLKSSRTISPWSMTDTVHPAPEINFPWLSTYNHLKARRPPLVLLTFHMPLAFTFLTFPTSDDDNQ